VSDPVYQEKETKLEPETPTNDPDKSQPTELVNVSDEELKQLVDEEFKHEDEQLLYEESFPVSIQVFWDNLLADNCTFPLKEWYVYKEEREIVQEEWVDTPPGRCDNDYEFEDEKIYNPVTIRSRSLNMVVKITGAPFCNSSKYS
jgi:hypothetical protein